jgi:hypothetical protein
VCRRIILIFYCEGSSYLKIIFMFMLILLQTLVIVFCVFDISFVTLPKLPLFPASGDWPTDRF